MDTYRTKPLEWKYDGFVYEANGIGFIVYLTQLYKDGVVYVCRDSMGLPGRVLCFDTIDEAKATAQAHHEAYIKQFLVEVTGDETETALAGEEEVK